MNQEAGIPFVQKKLMPNWLALRLNANGTVEAISPRASPGSEGIRASPVTFDEVISLVNDGQAIGARYLFSDGSFEDYDKKLLLAHFQTLGFLPAIENSLSEQDLNNPQSQWKPVIKLDEVTVPPFPIDTLPSVLRNITMATAEALQIPSDMMGIATLVACSICLQGKVIVQPKPDWKEPVNLFAVVVAPPAERKSAFMRVGTQDIVDYEYDDYARRKHVIEQNRVEKRVLQKEVETLVHIVSKDPNRRQELLLKQDELTDFVDIRPIRLITDDVTPEALGSLMAENNGRMAVVSAEGGIFEMLKGRYSQGINIDIFLKGHSGDPINIDRKGKEPEKIPNPCLSVLLAVQPQVLEGLINNDVFRGRGLTARFLYCLPKSLMGIRNTNPSPIPQQYADAYKNLLMLLLAIPYDPKPTVITLSSDAAALSDMYAQYLEKELVGGLENIADWGGKLHGAVLRIAGIIHAVNNIGCYLSQTPISKDTMESAITLGQYFAEHAKAAYQLMGADKKLQDAKFILRQLEKQPLRKFNRKYDVHRLCRSRISNVEGMMPGLQLLEELNYIKIFTQSGSKDFKMILNPLRFGN